MWDFHIRTSFKLIELELPNLVEISVVSLLFKENRHLIEVFLFTYSHFVFLEPIWSYFVCFQHKSARQPVFGVHPPWPDTIILTIVFTLSVHLLLETRCPQKLIGSVSFAAPLHWLPSWLAMQMTTAFHTVKAIVDVFTSSCFSGFKIKK